MLTTIEKQLITFTVPLTAKILNFAQTVKERHQNPRKQNQIYLQILAIYAVYFYCQSLRIKTDLTQGSFGDYLQQKLTDSADLDLPNLGKVECIGILPEDDIFSIPGDAWYNRLGYFIVEINQEDQEATILGYLPAPLVEKEVFTVDEIESVTEFLEQRQRILQGCDLESVRESLQDIYAGNSLTEIIAIFERIYRTCKPSEWEIMGVKKFQDFLTNLDLLDFSTPNYETEKLQSLVKKVVTKLSYKWEEKILKPLSQLFDNQDNYRWQLAESGTFRSTRSSQFRGGHNQKTKVVEEVYLEDVKVYLVREIELQNDGGYQIKLQVDPSKNNQFLPVNLELIIYDDDKGEIYYQVKSANDFPVLEKVFYGEKSEKFTIELKLGRDGMKESFVIK